jgi:hypothetical protein
MYAIIKNPKIKPENDKQSPSFFKYFFPIFEGDLWADTFYLVNAAILILEFYSFNYLISAL